MSLEESGIVPRVFGKMLGTNLPYSQYVKGTLLGQWYWDPSGKRDWIWALRLHGGAAFLYGSSGLDVPLTQRFFGGGSGSVRGWKARELAASPLPKYGGRAILEGSFEGRWNLLKGAGSLWFLDLEKFSTVFFVDAGNVWPEVGKMRTNEAAVAAGFGLRYNTVAGPIRIDFGMKMYNPNAPEGRRWFTQHRFFPEIFSDGVIHLGVGHAF
jgi:outer membrane protein assembly factor BamA